MHALQVLAEQQRVTFDKPTVMNQQIVAIEAATLRGRRPRHSGSNARLGAHGIEVSLPLLRVALSDGAQGFGFCRIEQTRAQELLGQNFSALYREESGVDASWRDCEYPLWDLAGQIFAQPVYTLAAKITGHQHELAHSAPCYDTSLYFDDLACRDDNEAANLMATEAREGFEVGHRAFKIKVGRGARHMELEAGTRRDIAIIRAIRQAVGPDCQLLLDANNGWNLNLTKRVLDETSDCDIFWIEEAFHEDEVLYRDLKNWLSDNGLETLIADGEGAASPHLLYWARDGLVDVIQYDIFGHGLSRWLETGQQLDEWGVRTAPHHYGGSIGNFVAPHLAGALKHFSFVEWDEAHVPGLNSERYKVCDGRVQVPDAPGFGLSLDEEFFAQRVRENGWKITA